MCVPQKVQTYFVALLQRLSTRGSPMCFVWPAYICCNTGCNRIRYATLKMYCDQTHSNIATQFLTWYSDHPNISVGIPHPPTGGRSPHTGFVEIFIFLIQNFILLAAVVHYLSLSTRKKKRFAPPSCFRFTFYKTCLAYFLTVCYYTSF
jgi:hypothetical protein